VGLSYLFARTLKIIRPRDDNPLPAPIDPLLGIPVWSPTYFKRPLLLQDNVYESTARAFYHGVVAEAVKRFSNFFSLNVNYTFSKAIDEVVDFAADFQPNDQLDLRAERALSSFHQTHKLVAYGVFDSPFSAVLLKDFTVAPIVRANSGRPFNLLVGFDLNADRHASSDRPAFAGRNTGRGPGFWTTDLRLTRRFALGEKRRLEVIAEGFNLLNRQNFQSINNVLGIISGPFDLRGREDRGPSEPLGFTSVFDPRRIQLGIRVAF
jgi:hypothetical protein